MWDGCPNDEVPRLVCKRQQGNSICLMIMIDDDDDDNYSRL